MPLNFRLSVAVLSVALASAAIAAQRRDAFVENREHPAIEYSSAPATNDVAALKRRLEEGTVSLRFDPASGYLQSALEALRVPVSSQALVFSQTSFQAPRIRMHNPRAVYFNDTVSVGWVRGGDILELAAFDPRQGVIFYQLDQKASARPQIERNDSCLACHLSWETLGVPGLMVQSVHPLPDERSYVNGYTTIHGSPLDQRWGGWWVTGNAGGAKHMGNVSVMWNDKGTRLPNPTRALPSLEGLFDLKGFPSAHSDVVAMFVLAHQTHMTNLMTRTGWEARLAASAPSPDASLRVREAARDLVDYLLFVDEQPLAAPVQGSSGFAEFFAAQGPRDSRGRSLRQFDLRRRLFRYPCSYMIYTEAFDALPPAAKETVYMRMWDVLSGRDTHPRYKVLSAADRQAIVQILRETKKDLPPYFR
jgi:hypothetical protein